MKKSQVFLRGEKNTNRKKVTCFSENTGHQRRHKRRAESEKRRVRKGMNVSR